MMPPLMILIVDGDPMILRTNIGTGTLRRLEKPDHLARLAEGPADAEFDQ
jgi:hypothetical protein